MDTSNTYISDNIVNLYNNKKLYNNIMNKYLDKYSHTTCFLMIFEYIYDRCKNGLDLIDSKSNEKNRILYKTFTSLNIYFP